MALRGHHVGASFIIASAARPLALPPKMLARADHLIE